MGYLKRRSEYGPGHPSKKEKVSTIRVVTSLYTCHGPPLKFFSFKYSSPLTFYKFVPILYNSLFTDTLWVHLYKSSDDLDLYVQFFRIETNTVDFGSHTDSNGSLTQFTLLLLLVFPLRFISSWFYTSDLTKTFQYSLETFSLKVLHVIYVRLTSPLVM